MNWRNPKKEFPEPGEVVWGLLDPHKQRGSLLESAPSMQIICGWADLDGSIMRIENADELGFGNIEWSSEDNNSTEKIIAWLPLNEMPLPGWIK